MSEFPIGRCKGCEKVVVWALDAEGKWIPLDPTPPVYHVALDPKGQPRCLRAQAAMVSHFATCPKANEFSGSKKKKEAGR